METETVSDLLALAKLYGLLNRNVAASQTGTSQLLDEKAHLFLKNLLDGAAKRVLQNHSEIIASQTGVPNETCSSQLELSPPLSPDISKPVHSVFPEEQPCVNPSTRALIRALSKCSISSTNPGNRSNCRACEWSNRDPEIHANNRVTQSIARTREFPSQRTSQTKESRNCDYVAKNPRTPLKVPSRVIKDRSVTNSTAQRGNDHKLKWSRRTITPTLLDHKFGKITGSPEFFSDTSSQGRSSSYSNSYDDNSSASFSSRTSLTSEQSSGSCGQSEAYSSSRFSSERTSGSYGESSEAYSSPRWTERHRKAGPIPKRKSHIGRDSTSSSSSASASASDVMSYSSYNVSLSRGKAHKPKPRRKQEKGKGGMRRVKNMFGFIFQPFHTNHGGREQSEGLGKSKWGGVQKMFRSSNKSDVRDVNRGAIQKSGKAGGTKGAGHLLGMLVHVRKAKKAKTAKGEGGIGNGESKQKKMDKKLKCWKKLNHHNKGKLPKRIGRNMTPKLQG